MGDRLDILTRDRDIRTGFLVASLVTLATLGLNLLVTWLAVVFTAARPRPRPDRGVVLVCGHRLVDGAITPAYRRRLDALAALLVEGSQLRAVLLGGGRPSEADAGRAYLVARHGIDPDRLDLEEHSANSFENLRNARDLIAGRAVEIHILSCRFHLARLGVFARQLGLDARLVPAEAAFLPGPRNLLATAREAAYLCWFLAGRAWARVTGNGRMMSRLR